MDNYKLFNPEEGVTIIGPEVSGPGWWAGAPAVCLDSASGDIYLSYRLRRPRGTTANDGASADRGAVSVLGRSSDGVRFETIWSMEKSSLNSPSLERSDIVKTPDGRWQLFISYVDGENNQWRTDVMEAEQPEKFNPETRRPLFQPAELGLAAVKDPVVLQAGGAWIMYLSVAAARGSLALVDHSTADAFDTGGILSHTALATSFNGRDFTWQGLALQASGGKEWDGYSARIAAVAPAAGRWIAFYDGAYGVENHYDETTGLAISADLRQWKRLTPDRPALAAEGGRCLRYVDVVRREDELLFYYEYGRPDGSHELRLNRAPVALLDGLE